MRVLLLSGIIALTVATTIAAAEDARERLTDKIESEAKEFCRSTHGTSGSLSPRAIKTAPGSSSTHPDLIVDYRGISCEGVKNAPLLQGGFCGLTMEGMKCQVKVFKYRKGNYVESKSYLK